MDAELTKSRPFALQRTSVRRVCSKQTAHSPLFCGQFCGPLVSREMSHRQNGPVFECICLTLNIQREVKRQPYSVRLLLKRAPRSAKLLLHCRQCCRTWLWIVFIAICMLVVDRHKITNIFMPIWSRLLCVCWVCTERHAHFDQCTHDFFPFSLGFDQNDRLQMFSLLSAEPECICKLLNVHYEYAKIDKHAWNGHFLSITIEQRLSTLAVVFNANKTNWKWCKCADAHVPSHKCIFMRPNDKTGFVRFGLGIASIPKHRINACRASCIECWILYALHSGFF